MATISKSPKTDSIQPKKKRITLTLSAPEANKVALVADFNNWDSNKLMKKDKEGVWKAIVDLKPGKYEYRYLVDDGEWRNDPKCDKFQLNSYGSYNCILEIVSQQ